LNEKLKEKLETFEDIYGNIIESIHGAAKKVPRNTKRKGRRTRYGEQLAKLTNW
jgi:hypothetical protein